MSTQTKFDTCNVVDEIMAETDKVYDLLDRHGLPDSFAQQAFDAPRYGLTPLEYINKIIDSGKKWT